MAQTNAGKSDSGVGHRAEEMAQYGIVRVPVDRFHYKDYRYTNLDDAIAQARREASPTGETAVRTSTVDAAVARREGEIDREAADRADNEGMQAP